MGYVENLLSSTETIILQRRQHPIRLLAGLIGLAFQIGFWMVLFVVLRTAGTLGEMSGAMDEVMSLIPENIQRFIPANPVVWIVGFFIAAAVWGYVRGIIAWFSSYDILTNRRVIQVRGVLSKYTSDTSLEKINDVNLYQTTLGRMLGYGNLTVMTASEVGINTMFYLPDPLDFKKAMLDAKMTLGGSGIASTPTAAPSQEDLTGRLGKLDTLRNQGLINEQEYQARRAKILDEV